MASYAVGPTMPMTPGPEFGLPMHPNYQAVAAGPGPAASEPETRSLVENGRRYELQVVQQPQ